MRRSTKSFNFCHIFYMHIIFGRKPRSAPRRMSEMYEEDEFEEYDDEFEEEIDGDGATEPPPPPPAPPRPTVQPQLAQVLPPASNSNRLALAPSAPPVPPAYAAIRGISPSRALSARRESLQRKKLPLFSAKRDLLSLGFYHLAPYLDSEESVGKLH